MFRNLQLHCWLNVRRQISCSHHNNRTKTFICQTNWVICLVFIFVSIFVCAKCAHGKGGIERRRLRSQTVYGLLKCDWSVIDNRWSNVSECIFVDSLRLYKNLLVHLPSRSHASVQRCTGSGKLTHKFQLMLIVVANIHRIEQHFASATHRCLYPVCIGH